jgi:hypothetical protein
MTDSYIFKYHFNYKEAEIEIPEELISDVEEFIKLSRLAKTARLMYNDDLLEWSESFAVEKGFRNKFNYLVEKLDIEIDSYYYEFYKNSDIIDSI